MENKRQCRSSRRRKKLTYLFLLPLAAFLLWPCLFLDFMTGRRRVFKYIMISFAMEYRRNGTVEGWRKMTVYDVLRSCFERGRNGKYWESLDLTTLMYHPYPVDYD